MRQICHLPLTREGLEKASKRGLRYYHTRCGTAVALQNLVSKESCDCGACLILSDKPVAPPPAAVPSAPDAFDLSDWSEIGAIDQQGRPPGASPASSSPPPMVQISYEELCTRLGMDPGSDPKGRLGTPEFDIREVLTQEERDSAAPILGMVKSLPMGAPLVEIVHRLCHELAWRRALAGRGT